MEVLHLLHLVQLLLDLQVKPEQLGQLEQLELLVKPELLVRQE